MDTSADRNTTYPLGDRLPADVVVGGNTVWGRYRQYPVFSLPWLRGRSLMFASVTGLVALLGVLGTGFSTRDYGVGLLSGGHLFVAFMLMATAGPALATWVRYRRWPRALERKAVVAAVLVGVVASYFADMWASAYVEREVLQAFMEVGQDLQRAKPASGLESGLLLAVNIVVLVVIYGMFGGGLSLRAYFSEQRRWQQARQRDEIKRLHQARHDSDLRLGALQAQVEPHFLFNTLASVRALVRRDADKAEQTLDALVDYLRATIPRLREGERGAMSTLDEQLGICERYLEVMRLRMGDRLRYAVDADDVVRASAFPPLLLITLVENAIKHGVEPARGPCAVRIAATVDGDMLVVGVHDNGVGLQPGMGSGVGLENVREQLRARYGGRATLLLRNADAGGALAELRVPLRPVP